MTPWIKVVTSPLGIAGFVLFLIFGYLARSKGRRDQRWLAPAAFAIATIALIGGFVLAYVEAPKPVPLPVQTDKPVAQAPPRTNQPVPQTSSGDGSPNVQGVQGNVTITVDQSTGKTTTQKVAGTKKSEQ